jgi:hypothetical protein
MPFTQTTIFISPSDSGDEHPDNSDSELSGNFINDGKYTQHESQGICILDVLDLPCNCFFVTDFFIIEIFFIDWSIWIVDFQQLLFVIYSK